jgi:CpeT/CpcT family (DUF1001)
MDQALVRLAGLLAGIYDNREQAIESPVWYVHLQAWWLPVNLFSEDSLTLFAEQANVLTPDRPYRQRLVRLCERSGQIQAQFYQFVEPGSVLGAGQNHELKDQILAADILELPGCVLDVQALGQGFSAVPRVGDRCAFQYPDGQGCQKTGQVELGFAVNPGEYHSYDKGINPDTGKAIWGAMMGPYRFTKRQDYNRHEITGFR